MKSDNFRTVSENTTLIDSQDIDSWSHKELFCRVVDKTWNVRLDLRSRKRYVFIVSLSHFDPLLPFIPNLRDRSSQQV